jgi:SAM-dependent methyltransferase
MIEEHRRLRALGGASRLVALSFLMLFTELALIRFAAAYVVYLAYFTNFVLLASFLGIGVGFLRAGRGRDGFARAPIALALVLGFVLAFSVQAPSGGAQRVLQGPFGMFALPVWVTLPILFAGVVVAMALLAGGVARTFARFEPLEAYRWDILGSIAGIVAFSGLSFLEARPVVWGIVIASLFVLLLGPERRRGQTVALIAIVGLLGLGSASLHDRWSPYYHVTVSPAQADGRVDVHVNGLPHQSILPVDRLRMDQPFYFAPYRHLRNDSLGDVLVIGAGTGNDVAVALSEGAKHVDAVEIDPTLQAIGEDRNPDQPYADPRVTVHIDDGRAFLERTGARYDLIVLALPDSLTLVSGQGSLRLESYLFTQEAIRSARDHLAAGGVFTMYNYYRPFVFDRFASTLADVYGHPPCIDHAEQNLGPRQQAVLTIGREANTIVCETPWLPSPSAVPAPATDDHPFPYLPGRSIPTFYAVSLLLILAASVGIVRLVTGPLVQVRPYLDLFCMGAAFLLLETKNVVQFALLFGTTWLVNSLVFAGILTSVFLAIEVTRRVRLPRPVVLYLALAVSLVVAWVVPPDRLLGLGVVARFVTATAVAFAPVFCANLIFAQRFKDTSSSTIAFGANLLGAMVGGVLEYGALVVGYRNLLVLVALLYTAAFVLESRGRRGRGRSAAGAVRSPAYTPQR